MVILKYTKTTKLEELTFKSIGLFLPLLLWLNYLEEGIQGSVRAAADSHVQAVAVVVMVAFAKIIYVRLVNKNNTFS